MQPRCTQVILYPILKACCVSTRGLHCALEQLEDLISNEEEKQKQQSVRERSDARVCSDMITRTITRLDRTHII